MIPADPSAPPPVPNAAPPPVGVQTVPVNPVAPAAPQAAPKPPAPVPGAVPVGGGAPAAPSIDMQNAQAHAETGAEQSDILGKKAANVGEQQSLQQVGNAAAAAKITELQANQAALENEHKHHLAESTVAGEARERANREEAAELRKVEIDPTNWYKKKGTAGTILAALSQAAGAFAAGMPHGSGQNFAGQIINDAINKDVEAQRSNLENKWNVHKDNVAAADRATVKDQWMANQILERKRVGLEHGIAMVGQMRAGTADEVKAKGLDQVTLGLKGDQVKLKDEQIDRMTGAKKADAAALAARQAAAAAEARRQEERNNFSAREMTNMTQHFVDQGYAGDDALRLAQLVASGGAAGSSPLVPEKLGGKKAGDDDAQKAAAASLDKLEADYLTAAPKAGAVTNLKNTITPGGTVDKHAIDDVNTRMAQTLKATGRMDNDAADRLAEQFKIRPWQSPEVQKANFANYRKLVEGNLAIGAKKSAAPEEPK
jgi:hypothetical protein